MTNLLLLRSSYQFAQYISHEQLIEKRKDEYYIALRKSQETFLPAEDLAKEGETEKDIISLWLNFFLAVVKEQAEKALIHLEEEKVEDTLSPKQYEVWKYIASVGEASPGDIVKSTNVGMPTVRQALERLVELGKVKRIGRGRGTRYVKMP